MLRWETLTPGRMAAKSPFLVIPLAGHEKLGHIDDHLIRLHMGIHLAILRQSLAMVRCVQNDIVLIRGFGIEHPEEFIHLKANSVVIGIDELLTSRRPGVDRFRRFHNRPPDRRGRIVRIPVAILEMETLLVDENEIAASFIQKAAENTGYAHILRGFEIDVALLERLLGHPPVQGSHRSPPGRLHERRKRALIDVDVDRLIAHLLCVVQDGRVPVGSKGLVGKGVVTGDQIGIADVGKGTGGDTDAEIPEEAPGFERLKERCGGTGVAVQAEIAATNRLVDHIDDAIERPLGGVKGRQVVSWSVICADVLKSVV